LSIELSLGGFKWAQHQHSGAVPNYIGRKGSVELLEPPFVSLGYLLGSPVRWFVELFVVVVAALAWHVVLTSKNASAVEVDLLFHALSSSGSAWMSHYPAGQ